MDAHAIAASNRVRNLRAFVAFAAAVAGVLTFLLPSGTDDAPALEWIALAVTVALAERTVLVIEFRKQAIAMTAGTAPLPLVAYLVSPRGALTIHLVGSTLAELSLGRPGPKTLVNLTARWIEAVVAIQLLVAMGAYGASDPTHWPAIVIALLVRGQVSAAVISLAIRIHDGKGDRHIFTGHVLEATTTIINASLGVLIVTLLVEEPWGFLPLLVLAALLLAALLAFQALIRQNRERALLHAFSASLATAVVEDELIPTLLHQATELLHAERAMLVVPATRRLVLVESTDPTTVVTLDDSHAAQQLHDRAVADMTNALHFDPVLDADVLAALGATEAMAVSFPVENGDCATMIVLDRRGDVRTFEPEDERLLATLAAHSGVSVQNGALVERLREEARIKEHMSLHDALTGLPNRTMFREILEAEMAASATVAVLVLDLDNFKDVNDTLGHQRGDELLCIIGERLSVTVGEDHLVARLGGDEFAVMIRGAELSGAFDVAHTIVDALRQSVTLADLPIDVVTSVGIVLAPEHSVDATTLLRYADIAMYIAKENRTVIEVYDPDRDDTSTDRLALMGELRVAIAERCLEVYFQPQLDLITSRVTGTEALVRWLHPRHGWIPPDRFIAIAERTGVIQDLTRLVLEKSLDENASWRRAGHDLTVSVNLSPRDLLTPGLVEDVGRMLRERHLPPESLCLELTEGAIMGDRMRSVSVLRRLRALGVGLAIDDFGQGQSSLAYLSQLPISEAKIDREFIMDLTPESEVIVRSVLMMGESFGFKVVAEGIENAAAADRLVELGCRFGQGYHFARPLPPFEFSAWLDKWLLEHAATV